MRKLFALAVALGLSTFIVAVGVLSVQKGRRPTADASGARATGEASTTSAVGRAPVIVELFTSEGCSSCPPADALLSRLDKTQPVEGALVIPLAMHVDYWNYLGWSDPFSSKEFSARQGEYANAYGKDGVYTPQMIVDGVKEFPGGNGSLALDEIAKAARTRKAEVKLTRGAKDEEGGGVRLGVRIEKLPKLTEGDAAYVLLALTESGLSTDVSRGENAGRRLGHVGVVRRLTTIGLLNGAPDGTFSAETLIHVEKNWRRENLHAVVFAQERGSRRIFAAAALDLK
ncbi:MAG: DUF1223 domain-containing protein [Acidobacteria bacterium]|nr:DUF1223 domain-containing protein [Acidobacteriota bacterium]